MYILYSPFWGTAFLCGQLRSDVVSTRGLLEPGAVLVALGSWTVSDTHWGVYGASPWRLVSILCASVGSMTKSRCLLRGLGHVCIVSTTFNADRFFLPCCSLASILYVFSQAELFVCVCVRVCVCRKRCSCRKKSHCTDYFTCVGHTWVWMLAWMRLEFIKSLYVYNIYIISLYVMVQ